MKRSRALAPFALLTGAVLALSACGSGGTNQSDNSEGSAVSDAGTLTGKCSILQYEPTTTAQYRGWFKGVEEFKSENSDLDVEWATTNFESFRSNAKVLLSGNDVPDAILVNTGNADAGQLAQQGLLDPLSDLVAEEGWDESVNGSIAALAIYDEEGHAGSGEWYGVPSTASYFTFYYNKDMLAEQGITEMPATVAELESIWDELLAAGITPVSSNAGEHAVLQTWWQLISSVADRSEIDNFILMEGPVDVEVGAFKEGTDQLQSWLDAGYLGQQLSGLKGDDMERAFISGEMPFMANGTWSFNRVFEEAPFDWGMMTFPEAELNAGASGHLWAIPANAKNKECGYEWIRKTMSPSVQDEIASLGGLPVLGNPEAVSDPQMKEMNQTFQELKDSNALSFYPDYPVAGLLDVQMSGLQALTSGSMTPSEFLANMQDFYDAGLK